MTLFFLQVNLLLASGFISAYVANKEEPLFRHNLNNTLKPQLVPQSAQDSKGGSFLYTLKGDDGLYYCHLFKTKDSQTVSEFIFPYLMNLIISYFSFFFLFIRSVVAQTVLSLSQFFHESSKVFKLRIM